MSKHRNGPSLLASLEPLPEVRETDTESSWLLFLALQSEDRTAAPPAESLPLVRLTVQDVMVEARRYNRVCPQEPQWQRLHALLLQQPAPEEPPPPPMTPSEAAVAPPLAKRLRVRDQVEWAERHGLLREVLGFLRSLPEEDWLHIGR
jgi:hypothetical protein